MPSADGGGPNLRFYRHELAGRGVALVTLSGNLAIGFAAGAAILVARTAWQRAAISTIRISNHAEQGGAG